jgi:hypothetical protein
LKGVALRRPWWLCGSWKPELMAKKREEAKPPVSPVHRRLFRRWMTAWARHIAALADDDSEWDELYAAWLAEPNQVIARYIIEYGVEWEKHLDSGGRLHDHPHRGPAKYHKPDITAALQRYHRDFPRQTWHAATKRLEAMMGIPVRAVRYHTKKLRWD